VFVEFSDRNAYGIKGYTAATYGDSFADVYDDWYSDLDDHDFVESIARDLPPHPVRILELGVGTGRLVQQLINRRSGITDLIVGVDSSQAMLDKALERHFAENVSLSVADFAQSLPSGMFDVIFIGYNTLFNLPDESAVRTCMQLVAERLSESGHFYFDVVRPIGNDNLVHRRIRSSSADDVVLSVSQHHPMEQRITGQFIHFMRPNGVRIRPYSVKYFSPDQLDAMATDCGLRLVVRTEDGDGTLFTADSPRHISKYTKSSISPSILKAP
jgi:SAM-dependent methyltransferase